MAGALAESALRLHDSTSLSTGQRDVRKTVQPERGGRLVIGDWRFDARAGAGGLARFER